VNTDDESGGPVAEEHPGGKMSEELWARSALDLAAAIARGEVSSREVVAAHLERIEAVNPRLNAVVRVLADDALAAADRADEAVTAGEALGPFHGVPITVKENIDCVGSPTTQGVPALAEAYPDMDAPVVERMRAAGAIPIGRTNLPEMGLRFHTDNALHGLTLNPWNRDVTAGGSSGGEAAALATGMSPLGLGNDIGGSLRNPAYACGIASVKPTTGRVPAASAIEPRDFQLSAQLMGVQGTMARHIRDVRKAFEVVSGRHWRDPISVTAPLEGPTPPSPLTVALVPEVEGVATDPDVAAGVRAAGAALEAAGYRVDEIPPPDLDLANQLWGEVLQADVAALRPLLEMVMSEPAVKLLDLFAEMVPTPDANRIAHMHIERFGLARRWSEFMVEHPLIVGPVWVRPPFVHDADVASMESSLDAFERLRFITPANVLGTPSVVVPVGVASGMPQGVQVMADRFREDLAFDAATILEDTLGRITPIDPRF